MEKYWCVLRNLCDTAIQNNETPVSAVLVHNKKIIAQAHNQTESLGNPTNHAEIFVLQKGFDLLGKSLEECYLYISLEPCPMCAHAIILSRIPRVYFGAYDIKGGGVAHGPRLFDSYKRIEWYGGFYEQDFESYLKHFFQGLR